MRMKRFNHDLSFMHNLSANMGYLIPIAAVDVLPGDQFQHATNLLARVAPLAKPVMHPVEIRVHNWYVPNRIIWEDWEGNALAWLAPVVLGGHSPGRSAGGDWEGYALS